MQTAKRYLLIALTFSAALVVFAVANPTAVRAVQASLTQVINTAANPVPTAAIGVTQVSGAVNVSNAVNSPVPTQNVDEHARQPFQRTFLMGLADGESSLQDSGFTIPAGKRLVIEQVSGFVTLPTNQIPFIFVESALQGESSASVYPVPVKEGAVSVSADSWRFANPVLLYGDATLPIIVGVSRNSNSGLVNCHITVSGYLITP